MTAPQNTSINAWMLHNLECPCIKCVAWRKQHGPNCECGLKSCYERRVLLEDGELNEELV